MEQERSRISVWMMLAIIAVVAAVVSKQLGANLSSEQPLQQKSASSSVSVPETYPPLTMQQLQNAHYSLNTEAVRSTLIDAGLPLDIVLHAGTYVFAADRMHDKPYVSVTLLKDKAAIGDLDGDGNADAVVSLELNGRAGKTIELALVRNERGNPLHAGTYQMNLDEVYSVRIGQGSAEADIGIHTQGEPSGQLQRSTARLTLKAKH